MVLHPTKILNNAMSRKACTYISNWLVRKAGWPLPSDTYLENNLKGEMKEMENNRKGDMKEISGKLDLLIATIASGLDW